MTQMYPTSIFHSSDGSLYNLVLNNTVNIVYKFMYFNVTTECASSPILCYLVFMLAIKHQMPVIQYWQRKNHRTAFFCVCKNANGLLVYAVYIYTVSMFLLFYVCRLISRKIISFITVQVIFWEKRQATLLCSLLYWYVSFSAGNMTAGSHDQAALRL